MPQCYVMMPYGGDDPEKQKFYEGVYSSIIVAAARKAGFSEDEIIREDHKGEAGTVSRNIVKHLAESDVLIADLTGRNANVFYELGVAHVFHKSSTVLICQKGTEIPFDVQGLNIVLYSTSIGEVADSHARIASAIVNRLSGESSADNTIHESIPQLPEDLFGYISSDDGDREDFVTQLSIENQQLRKQLEALGVNPSNTKNAVRSPREIIARAKASLPYSGQAAINTFRKYADAKDFDSLFDYFMEVVDYGQLSVDDAYTIIQICEATGNVLVMETAIEVFAQMYPNDAYILLWLGKAYVKRPGTSKRAIEVVNQAIGLEQNADGEYCAVNKVRLTHTNLELFFRVYKDAGEEYADTLIDAGRYLVCHGAEKEEDSINIFIFEALCNQKRFDEAREMLHVIENQGSCLAYYSIAYYYRFLGQDSASYEYMEKALVSEPINPAYYVEMAKSILGMRIARIDQSTICPVDLYEAQLAAAPFLLYALQRIPGCGLYIQGEFKKLFKQLPKHIKLVDKYITGEIRQIPLEGLDVRPLQCCLDAIKAAG